MKEIWVIESTTYFGSNTYGFTSRKKAENYVEETLNSNEGFDEKIVDNNMTIYVESANEEDVYVKKLIMMEVKGQP